MCSLTQFCERDVLAKFLTARLKTINVNLEVNPCLIDSEPKIFCLLRACPREQESQIDTIASCILCFLL